MIYNLNRFLSKLDELYDKKDALEEKLILWEPSIAKPIEEYMDSLITAKVRELVDEYFRFEKEQ